MLAPMGARNAAASGSLSGKIVAEPDDCADQGAKQGEASRTCPDQQEEDAPDQDTQAQYHADDVGP
jgi:hypothetical protein